MVDKTGVEISGVGRCASWWKLGSTFSVSTLCRIMANAFLFTPLFNMDDHEAGGHLHGNKAKWFKYTYVFCTGWCFGGEPHKLLVAYSKETNYVFKKEVKMQRPQ